MKTECLVANDRVQAAEFLARALLSLIVQHDVPTAPSRSFVRILAADAIGALGKFFRNLGPGRAGEFQFYRTVDGGPDRLRPAWPLAFIL